MRKPIIERGNRPIDRMRESAGSAKIPDGHGNAITIKGVGSRMYVLAEKGVSSGVFADDIDPERTNPNIPFLVQRTELAYGADTPFVQATLGAAFALVEKTHLPEHINQDELLSMALDVASNLAAVTDTTTRLSP